MARLVAVTACPTGIAHTIMAAEALRRVATLRGHSITVETQGSEGIKTPLSDHALAEADAVIIAADIQVDDSRFAGKPVHRTSTAVAIRETDAVIAAALDAAGLTSPGTAQPTIAPSPAVTPPPPTPAAAPSGRRGKLVAITACPTGIAHTFMAAEALKKAAADAGYDLRVETQGSVGAKRCSFKRASWAASWRASWPVILPGGCATPSSCLGTWKA